MEKIKVFDSHFHIIDPKYPVVENQGFTPRPFTIRDYLRETDVFELVGGAIVSGSFQQQGQSFLVAAVNKLGDNFVGVTQILDETSNDTIMSLDRCGVRAVRFNMKRGGSEKIARLSSLAARVYELASWHVELYIDSKDLDDLYSVILGLPAVSIDHLGLSKAGFPIILKLAEAGVKVKASGFGRLDFDPASALRDLYEANPDGVMFGTDLPSTRAPRPFRTDDAAIICDTFGEEAASKVFVKNAAKFYRLKTP